MSLFLGLDVGTQGTKALVLDAGRGAVVARASRSYGLIEGLEPGAAEQHPDTWIEAVSAVAREVFTQVEPGKLAGPLAGIGVSGQQHGCVALDEAGEVVRPAKLWCDTATADEARELSEQLGRHVPAGFTASKVLWLQRHEPEAWGRARTVLLPHDYVNLRLTGRATAEAGDASGTGYFDPVTRAYDPAALELLGLVGRVPELVEAGERAGELSAQGAELLGLPPACVGVPVSAGGGDNMMSAIGSGAVRPGVAVCSLGTSATVFAHVERPAVDPEGLIAPFCDSTGGWLPLLCVMNATGVLEEIKTAFETDHETLTNEAGSGDSSGLLFLPFLQGERVPDLPRATGSITGLTPGSLRRGALYRAALEGITCNLAWGLERMRALGLAIDSVRLAGGGAGNPLWQQMLADAFGVPVAPLVEPESAALGAALQASWTASAPRRPLDELVAAAVEVAQVREPTQQGIASFRALGERFREQVRREYGPLT